MVVTAAVAATVAAGASGVRVAAVAVVVVVASVASVAAWPSVVAGAVLRPSNLPSTRYSSAVFGVICAHAERGGFLA